MKIDQITYTNVVIIAKKIWNKLFQLHKINNLVSIENSKNKIMSNKNFNRYYNDIFDYTVI